MQAFRTYRQTRGATKSGIRSDIVHPYDDSWVGNREMFVLETELGHRVGQALWGLDWDSPDIGCQCFSCRIGRGE